MSEKKEVQSGNEADENRTAKTPPKPSKKPTPQKEGEATTKPKGKTFQENKITDSETARERGRNGGIKSGEVRRAQRDARETIRYMLGRMTKSENVQLNLKELGFEAAEYSNMATLHGRLFTMAMGGNLEAYMTLMRMGGYEPEETRKERESLAADRRREIELNAKVEALGSKGDDASVAINMNDEDNSSDVVIYIPKMMTEEECEVPSDDTEGADV